MQDTQSLNSLNCEDENYKKLVSKFVSLSIDLQKSHDEIFSKNNYNYCKLVMKVGLSQGFQGEEIISKLGEEIIEFRKSNNDSINYALDKGVHANLCNRSETVNEIQLYIDQYEKQMSQSNNVDKLCISTAVETFDSLQ